MTGRVAGPRGLPLLGNLLPFLRDPLGFLTRCARYGDFVPFRLGPKQCVLVGDPELIRQVAVAERRSLVRGWSALLLRTVLGNGLLVSEGSFWERQRHAVQRALNPADVLSQKVIDAAVERMAGSWRPGEVRDMHEEMRRLTLDIAARAIIGIEPASGSDRLDSALEVMVAGEGFSTMSLHPALSWLPTPVNRRAQKGRRLLDDLVYAVIDGRSQANGSPNGSVLRSLAPPGGDGMDRRELRDELVTLLFTAYDTTAAALCWTLYLVGLHPEVEDRILAAPDAAYLEQVVLESLRLFPPVPIQGRQVVSDCIIGEHAVAKGMMLVWSQWVMHRDPRYFDRADEFDPGRWADGLVDRLPPFVYFPFGRGRRNCVGEDFGMTMVIAALAAILAGHRLHLLAGYRARPDAIVTLRPRGGLPMRIEVRNPPQRNLPEADPVRALTGSARPY